ncbi:hypothetical protein ACFU6R_11365 [Streptomyces sp. NPDC057499]|uniref:hypothetical protein n=1 Tax=Streptomyces sp. NPDC057499 TaxID=3346150 RepID=UPI0036CF3CC7
MFGEPLVAQVPMADGSDPGDASVVFTALGGKALFGGTKWSVTAVAMGGIATGPPLKLMQAGPWRGDATARGTSLIGRDAL